jgi:glycosidase
VRRSASGFPTLAAAVCLALTLAAAAAAALPAERPRPPQGSELRDLARPPVRGPLASERLYFVLTDRYANGDTSNDRGGLSGGRGVTGYDPADIGFFHGGDFKGLTGDCEDPSRGLARVKELGFTGIWVTPPYKQRSVQGSSAAYHGYWALDFTTVDPHLGTEADFAAFVGCAHRLGLKVYLDVVVNHTADVIQPTGGTGFLDQSRLPYRDCRGRVFDPARYAGGSTFPCLSAARMPRVPVVLAQDRNIKRPAWLNDVTRYHNRGDINWDSCSALCFEQGDFYGLDDLFTEQPAVVRGLADVYASWIRRFKVDGFRVDTAKHVDRAFFRAWTPRIMAAARAAGVRDFQLFGEAWIGNAVDLSSFVHERGLRDVLDFPFQSAAVGFASGDAGALGVSQRLADDDYFGDASGRAHVPPTFLGNHDMGRAARLIQSRARGASGDVLLRRVLLGHSLLYLLRGAPVVLYGDEVGMIGEGGDKQARQDMFPTVVPEWRTAPRVGSPPIGTGSSFDVVGHPVGEHLRALAALREEHPALATGATAVRHARERVLAVSRIDADGRREYLAAFNAGTAAARITVPTATPSSSWRPLLGAAAPVRSGADGRLTLTVPPLTAVLLRADEGLPVRRPSRPALRVAADDFADLWRLTAQVGAADPVSVTFAVRREGAARWTRLAVDDSPAYRAFLDPSRFRRNERVHLVAIVRGLDGATSVSAVTEFRVRRP